jgi:hypothetical protein
MHDKPPSTPSNLGSSNIDNTATMPECWIGLEMEHWNWKLEIFLITLNGSLDSTTFGCHIIGLYAATLSY